MGKTVRIKLLFAFILVLIIGVSLFFRLNLMGRMEKVETVNKNYTAYIFSDGTRLVNSTPVTITGELRKDGFVGTVTIEGQTTEIFTVSRDANRVFQAEDGKSYYTTSNKHPESLQGITKLDAYIVMAQDLSAVYGTTSTLRKEYGEASYFKSHKNLKTGFEFKGKSD
jgi:hypothetical protein